MRYMWDKEGEQMIVDIWHKINNDCFREMLSHANQSIIVDELRETWIKEPQWRIMMKHWLREDKIAQAKQMSMNRGVKYDKKTGIVTKKALGTYRGGCKRITNHARDMELGLDSDEPPNKKSCPASQRERSQAPPKCAPSRQHTICWKVANCP